MSMGAIFSHMEEFNDTRLLFTRFHVIRHLVRLPPPLPSGVRQQNLWDIGGKVQPLLPYHLHPPLTSWTNIIKYDPLVSDLALRIAHRVCEYIKNILNIINICS